VSLSSRDPVTVARSVKALIQSGDWERQVGRDAQTKVMLSLKSRLPLSVLSTVVEHLPVSALVALTKQPPSPGCHWCAAVIQRGLGESELPRNEALLALLGRGCDRCQQRWAVADRAAELRAEDRQREALTASLCRGRPWLAAALAGPAHGPGSLHQQLDRDAWRMGAQRAAAKWGIEPGIFLGDRAAMRRVARHPVWGPALTKVYGDV
jgi:hypothetical protein